MNAIETRESFLPGEEKWKAVRWAIFILLQNFPEHQDEIKEFACQIPAWAGLVL